VARERNVFANFERMRREVDQLFGDVFERTGVTTRGGFVPRVDVYYAPDPPVAVVTADLAGVALEDIGLEIRGRKLVISGERRPRQSGGRLYQQIEIEHGPFRRAVELGADVHADAARATYEDGMLRVEIPLLEAEQVTRRVPIDAGRARPTPASSLPESDPGEAEQIGAPARARGRLP